MFDSKSVCDFQQLISLSAYIPVFQNYALSVWPAPGRLFLTYNFEKIGKQKRGIINSGVKPRRLHFWQRANSSLHRTLTARSLRSLADSRR